jgi:hypothetical protein
MPAVTEVARLRRDVEELRKLVDVDLRTTGRSAMTAAQKRTIKSEIEWCIQELDDLRSRLTDAGH